MGEPRKTHVVVVPDEIRKWVAGREDRMYGLVESVQTVADDLAFQPERKTPFRGLDGWFIVEYNKNQGVGVCHLYVVYALSPPGYVTVKGIAVPELGERIFLQ